MMRKKESLRKSVILSLSACAVTLFILILFSAAAASNAESKQINEIGELVVIRAETMNDYYTGELEYIHAEEILQDIETGKMLEDDLASLKAWEHTDIDTVNRVEILDIMVMEDNTEEVSAQVAVSWNVSGLSGTEEFEVIYETVCEKSGKTLKLTQFF